MPETFWIVEYLRHTAAGEPLGNWLPHAGRYSEAEARRLLAEMRDGETRMRNRYSRAHAPETFRLVKVTREVEEES